MWILGSILIVTSLLVLYLKYRVVLAGEKCKGKIVGILLFSNENSELCFLAVAAEYRRRHIAEKMLSYMFTKLDSSKDIFVTTYRDGVPEGIAARAFYKRMGFVEGKLTEEFGSPVQEFVLKR